MEVVKFGDIAELIQDRITPKENNVGNYIGLENLPSESLLVTSWQSDVVPDSDKFLFKKGDVLFARRRAYQKKVGVAPFDGIISTDGMVFRPKSCICESILPFIVKSDHFMNYAINNSAGTMSPRVKWKDLQNCEIKIPNKELQKTYSNLLWNLEKTIMLLNERLIILDQLVKSRFIEMFGTLDDPKVPFKQLGDVATYINGYAFKPSDWGTEGLPIIRIQNLSGSGDSFNYYSGTYPENIVINKGDVMISWSATLGVYVWNGPKALLNQHIFKVYFDKMDVNPTYFRIAVKPALEYSSSQVHGSTMTHLTKKTFDAIKIAMPPIDLQNQFAAFVEQIDKSKFELQRHLDDTKRLQKALIDQAFNPESVQN